MSTSAGVGNPIRDIPHMVTHYCNLVVLCLQVQEWVTHLGIFPTWSPITAAYAMPTSQFPPATFTILLSNQTLFLPA